jgi:hypothetical protein
LEFGEITHYGENKNLKIKKIKIKL